MAGLFDASTVQMRQTATQVEQEADTIRTELQALLGQLQALQGQWIGDGRTAFLGAQARYQDANARLNQALSEISRLIKTNEARYTADDAQASGALNTAAAAFDVPGF